MGYCIRIASQAGNDGNGKALRGTFKQAMTLMTHPVIPAKAGTLMQNKDKTYLSHYDCQPSWQ